MSDLNKLEWRANARGTDPHGVPIVAIYGSEQMVATERVALVEAAPDLYRALRTAFDVFADDLSDHTEPDGRPCECGQCQWQLEAEKALTKANGPQ